MMCDVSWPWVGEIYCSYLGHRQNERVMAVNIFFVKKYAYILQDMKRWKNNLTACIILIYYNSAIQHNIMSSPLRAVYARRVRKSNTCHFNNNVSKRLIFRKNVFRILFRPTATSKNQKTVTVWNSRKLH